jgi:hypothetical protein
VGIGDENPLIASIRVHDPVPDSVAQRESGAIGRPGGLVTIDPRGLVGELFSVAAVGVDHPSISVFVFEFRPECDLGSVRRPYGDISEALNPAA